MQDDDLSIVNGRQVGPSLCRGWDELRWINVPLRGLRIFAMPTACTTGLGVATLSFEWTISRIIVILGSLMPGFDKRPNHAGAAWHSLMRRA